MPPHYRLDRLTFSDGTNLSVGNLVVLLGPNNCGKSRALKDILGLTCFEKHDSVVVTDVKISRPDTIADLANLYSFSAHKNVHGRTDFHFLTPTLDKPENFNIGVRDWPTDFGKGSAGQDLFYYF